MQRHATVRILYLADLQFLVVLVKLLTLAENFIYEDHDIDYGVNLPVKPAFLEFFGATISRTIDAIPRESLFSRFVSMVRVGRPALANLVNFQTLAAP